MALKSISDREPSEWTWNNGEVAMAVDPLNFEDLLTEGKQQSWKGLPAGHSDGSSSFTCIRIKKDRRILR